MGEWAQLRCGTVPAIFVPGNEGEAVDACIPLAPQDVVEDDAGKTYLVLSKRSAALKKLMTWRDGANARAVLSMCTCLLYVHDYGTLRPFLHPRALRSKGVHIIPSHPSRDFSE